MKKKILRGIAVLCSLACVVSVYQAAKIQYEYKQGEQEYSELAGLLVSKTDSSIYVSQKEAPETSAPVDVDFDLLKEMNVEAVGWLYCEGTPINYPVVQSEDNSYYLNHLYDDQKNSSGAIFMDALNSPDLSDANTIIYGHNMKNGTMFASLMNYESQKYYEKHPVMYYITKDHSYRIDIFASYETSGDSEAFTIFFDSEHTYGGYLQRIWGRSRIDTANIVPMTTADNIVTLTTCSYSFNNARYVVQGKVTPLN